MQQRVPAAGVQPSHGKPQRKREPAGWPDGDQFKVGMMHAASTGEGTEEAAEVVDPEGHGADCLQAMSLRGGCVDKLQVERCEWTRDEGAGGVKIVGRPPQLLLVAIL